MASLSSFMHPFDRVLEVSLLRVPEDVVWRMADWRRVCAARRRIRLPRDQLRASILSLAAIFCARRGDLDHRLCSWEWFAGERHLLVMAEEMIIVVSQAMRTTTTC